MQAVDSGLLLFAKTLNAEHGERAPRILCPSETARFLAALADVRVYAANAWRTPHYGERRRRLGAAGIEVDVAGSKPLPISERLTLLEALVSENDVDDILVKRHAPARAILEHCVAVRIDGRYGEWVRFRRVRK
jgi:hypothetical protein